MQKLHCDFETNFFRPELSVLIYFRPPTILALIIFSVLTTSSITKNGKKNQNYLQRVTTVKFFTP